MTGPGDVAPKLKRDYLRFLRRAEAEDQPTAGASSSEDVTQVYGGAAAGAGAGLEAGTDTDSAPGSAAGSDSGLGSGPGPSAGSGSDRGHATSLGRGRPVRARSDVVGALAAPPSIGRVARSWRRHLTSEDWPRPSLAADFGELGGLTVAGASVTGRTHAHRGTPRQDAYGFKLVADTVLCAIADGVSTALLGGQAADVAVTTALGSASEPDAHRAAGPLDRLSAAVRDAGAGVEALARELLPVDPDAGRQCATTLVVVAALPDPSGGLQVHVASVGDSSVLELTQAGDVRRVVGPDASTHSQALRDYLPQRAPNIEAVSRVLAPGSILLLATDGLAWDLHQSPTVRDWVTGQLRDADSIIAAANVLSYTRQGSGDDLTFVALSRARRW